MNAISIVIADAQHLIRAGLRHLVSQDDRFRVVGEASNEPELQQQLMTLHPDVVILDYHQEGAFSISTINRLKKRHPEARIMVMSDDDEKERIYQVLQLGVNGFLTKGCGEEEVFDAIKATARGEKLFCTRVLDYLLEKSFPDQHKKPSEREEVSCGPTPLSPREIEIVRLVARGLIAKEIASELNLSTHTIYTHRKNIMKKLNLSSASELILYAVEIGIVDGRQIPY
ncbi:MAG: response regulator transcription factor [Phaeodactylibacter sp.]|uniref:response regulator transcription factor n=1 Tax=Phaeodactylibacter sp. TaxID=1940289 RepID=UPI0032EBAEEE